MDNALGYILWRSENKGHEKIPEMAKLEKLVENLDHRTKGS